MAIETLRITFTDGRTPVDVVPNLFDQVAFERALRNNKQWGKLQDNILRMQVFRGWSAANRTGVLDMSWEDFNDDPNTPVQSVTVVHDDDEDDDDELEVEGLGKGTRAIPSTTSS
ncbi:MAG TPA: hypothetical protein VNJ04_11750 [Gemmatimonadaceae bacterium]|nr:hypothetical protein [Gemmatimonadaceae bacterium]